MQNPVFLDDEVDLTFRLDGFAVDFRREIPAGEAGRWFQHQGIYAYSRKSRDEFTSLSRSKLELERSLEQMRIMGIRPIRMVQSPYESISVDVPSDANAVEALLHEQKKQGLPDGRFKEPLRSP